MSAWKEQTKHLAEAIKESDEYKEFSHYKDIIMENAELFRIVNEYRKEAFTTHVSDKDHWLHNYEQLRSRYEDTLMMKEVEKFLLAEMKLCRLYRTIWETLCEDGGMNIDFLDGI